MSRVAAFGGVEFVDDSKATNLAAMLAGIRMTGGPVRLIAGGLLKEKGLEIAKEWLATTVRRVYLIGEAAGQMEAAWSGAVSCCRCGSLVEAVRTAWSEAGTGETVLLSPGCASFDQFESFKERGNRFREAVRALEG
jgi:UDP-N-acetylmuramoylalanine--D-glutamate ligase